MAIDTAGKRYSMIGLAAPVPSLLPIPDGTIAQADRQAFIWLYSGILVSALQLATGVSRAAFTITQPGATFTTTQPGATFTVTT